MPVRSTVCRTTAGSTDGRAKAKRNEDESRRRECRELGTAETQGDSVILICTALPDCLDLDRYGRTAAHGRKTPGVRR
jgi:hypothetical protein